MLVLFGSGSRKLKEQVTFFKIGHKNLQNVSKQKLCKYETE